MSEVDAVREKALTVPDQMRMIVVTNQESLVRANEGFLVIKGLRKEIAKVFDPMEEAAKDAKRKAEESRKEIVRQREKVEEPLVKAEAYLNDQITRYRVEQDRIRRQEEEKARQEAMLAEMARRKAEEEERIARAAALEAAGAKEEAEAVIAEAMEEIEKPVEVYVQPPPTPKVELKGMATVEYWSAEVTDLRALCRAIGEGKCPTTFVDANMTPLNNLARQLRDQMKVAGVKPVCRVSSRATGR